MKLAIFLAAMLAIVSPIFAPYFYSMFFSPRYEAIRNETFHNSQSYNDGMIRDLQDLKLEYLKASPVQKDALRSVIIHRFSVYEKERLPLDLRDFYSALLGE
jgi:hypothetical protein